MLLTKRRGGLMVVPAVLLCFTVITSHTAAAQTPVSAGTASAGALIRAAVSSGRHAGQRWPLLTDVRRELQSLYDSTSDEPLWSRGGQPTASATLVVQQLALLDARGLTPSDYDAALLQRSASLPITTAREQADFDITLTTAVLRALRALRFGRIPAALVHAQLGAARDAYDVVAVVRTMTTERNPALAFDSAEPPFLHYHLLKNAMARYRTYAQDPTLAPIGTLRTGAQDDGVPALRRLFAARIAQMALTLERWRWLPHDLGDPSPIIVNVPAFRLHAFTENTDRESALISMDVVVGDAYNHRTPVFSGALQYLVFSPYWDVPPSITRREMLPKARRDHGYLARGNYEVVGNGGGVLGTSPSAVAAVAVGRARIRQKPGPTNALGRVKFIFPNDYNVYLHDTPAQSVFDRARRDASHSCIRIADPMRLAAFLLRDQPQWDSTAIAAAMNGVTPQQVHLTRRVPVHIVYATTVAREDGAVLFYDDIYGHDRTLAALLAKGYPYDGSR